MPRPDAILLPASTKTGNTQLDRIDSVLAIAEPILEVKRPQERGYIRQQVGKFFVTRDFRDTLYGRNGTPDEGKPRYRWEAANIPGVEGAEVGYLVNPPQPETPATS